MKKVYTFVAREKSFKLNNNIVSEAAKEALGQISSYCTGVYVSVWTHEGLSISDILRGCEKTEIDLIPVESGRTFLLRVGR